MYFDGRNLNIDDNFGNRATGPNGVSHIFTMWDPDVTFNSHIYTLGLSADGAIPAGGFTLSYRAEAVYAGGELTEGFHKEDFGPTTQREEKLSGFALLLGGTANFGGMATLTLEGAYGSGDHRGKVSRDNWGSGETFEGFHVPMAQWGRTVWFDEYSFYADTNAQALGTNGDPFDFAGQFGNGVNKPGTKRTGAWNQRGLENLAYITLGGTVTPLPPLTLGLDVFKMWASQATPKGGFDPESRIIYSKQQDRDLGWEIDLTAKWTMNKNFAVTGAFCPWIPGDYFKVPKGSVFVDDPTHLSGAETVEKSSSLSWGYVARANCVFTF
jgi:hypothetical protein